MIEESSKFLLEIITLVSSANKMSPGNVFIVGGRSFMYIMKSRGPKIDPWGTPHFAENFFLTILFYFLFFIFFFVF
jgi:hypothetical protein